MRMVEIPDWMRVGKCSSCAFRQLESENLSKKVNGIMNMNCPFISYTDQPDEWTDISTFEEEIPNYPGGCPVKIINVKKKKQS